MSMMDILEEYKKLNPDWESEQGVDNEIARIEEMIQFRAEDFSTVKLNSAEYQAEYRPYPKGTYFDSERWKADRAKLFQSNDKNASICLRDYIILPADYEGEDSDIYELENHNIS